MSSIQRFSMAVVGFKFRMFGYFYSITLPNRWDALFNGSYNRVKLFRIPPEYRHMALLTFHARSPNIQASEQARNQLTNDILEIHEDIRFGFFSGYTNPLTHLPRSRDKINKYIFGSTNTVPFEDHTKVWIAVELLQPLLRHDLTDSER